LRAYFEEEGGEKEEEGKGKEGEKVREGPEKSVQRMATWTLSCTVSEIRRLKGQKSSFSISHSYSG